MSEVFINKDAEFLQTLCENITDDRVKVRLMQVARNLQSMDDRQGSEYSRGWNDHKNSHLARSNLVKQTSVPVFPGLEEALKSFKGEVQKLPPEQKQNMKDTLTVDDLDF
jgi:hypothetical protein